MSTMPSASPLHRWLASPPRLEPADLVPRPEHFQHESDLHGQRHVARVMVHAFRLVAATGHDEESSRLWGAVYLHDLARTHDGRCHRHGADAWTRFTREPALQGHLEAGGVVAGDHEAIRIAVITHCKGELEANHPHYRLTALLKDADGLDRVRLGDLDPRYLRHPEARSMVAFAEALYDATDDLPQGPAHFDQVLHAAAALEGASPADGTGRRPLR